MESPDEQGDVADKKKKQAEEEAVSGLEDISDDDEEEEGDGEDDDEEDEDGDEDEEWESDGEAADDNEAGDSGDDDDEGDEDDDDDDEDEEEEEDAVLEASESEGEGGERCPICLNRFKDQDVGTPEACDHVFCLECIQEWSMNVNTCPVDRQVFKLILCKHGVDDIIYKKLTVEDVNKQADAEEEEELTYCQVCHQCDREDRLLLCDGCDFGYHLECLNPPLSQVPVDEWFCPNCARREGADADYVPHAASGYRRQIPRTLVMERVRSAIEERRVRRTLRRIVSSDEEDEDEEEAVDDTAPAAATSSSASSPVKKSPVKKSTTKRKTPRKYARKKKRKTTKKKTTKKATGRKKKATTKTKKKTTKKRKTKRKGKKGKKLKRLARTAKPAAVTSVKARIAGALGITNPPPGRTIPMQKLKQEKSLDMKRTDIGAASLSIFGHRDQINYYEDEQDDEPGTSSNTASGSVGTRKYSRLALSSYKPIGRVPAVLPLRKKEKIVIKPLPGVPGSGVDLLGSIMQGQDILHMSSKSLTIQRDGSLTTRPKDTLKKTAKKTSDTSPTSSSLFKSSFTAVDSSSTKSASVLSSLSTGKGMSESPDEEYDPAFPTDEFDDEMADNDKMKSEDVYDPAHPTDDLSSDEDIADNSDSEARKKADQQKKDESGRDRISKTNENIRIKVEKEVSIKVESKDASSVKTGVVTKAINVPEKSLSLAKSTNVSKVKDSAIFSEIELDKRNASSKDKLSLGKKESDKKTSPEMPLAKEQKTLEKLGSAEKKENIKKSPSIKITETNKKSFSNVKPFEISRKTLFEKRRLYGGEIDFSEDVDFSEGAFPDTFELSVKRIEEVFKGTKSKVEPKSIDKEAKVVEPEKPQSGKSDIESTEKSKTEKVDTDKDVKEKSEKEIVLKLSKQGQEDKVKVKSEKDSKEKIKFTGKFKPIGSNSDENVGTTKISVSDRFKKISEDRKTPETTNLEEEDPIHEMRKLDKELDLEFGNADFVKKKEKDKEIRKSKRKVSLDENDSENIRHRRESKENREKRKSDAEYKYVYEEKEEGEVDDEIRLKEKKRKDRKKRKVDKERDKYYDEKVDSDIDRRIVIQVSQNTEDRTVWEEEERQRKKRDREDRRKDKEKMKEIEKDIRKERKYKRLRSRSRSHERRNRSRSREKRRSKSRSRDRDRSRERTRRKRRERSRSRSREWSHERSRKKKKRDRNRSRDRDRDVSREWSRDRSRDRDWSKERDWSSERGRDRSRGHSRDRKRSGEHSVDKVDIFGRSRSPFTRREFLKDKQNLTPRKKPKPPSEDDDVIVLDSPPPPKKPTYDEVSSSESEKEEEPVAEKIETISRIEVKDSSAREVPAPFVEAEDKDDEFDSEPEETEQFQYTDRDEFLGQNKSKQMRQNLITIGVSGNAYDPANPTGTSSPAPPPLPEPMSAPTPPLPPGGDFTQFPPPPPGPPPQGPPPGSVILQERHPLHVQANAPPGQGILGEGPIILQGPPPSLETGPPPGIIQQRPPMSVPVNINVMPPGFHRGLPPTITPQRQLIVSPLRPAAPRLQRLASPGGVRFGWQVTTTSEVIPSQFGSRLPSPSNMPGHPMINGPFDGLPPPQSEALPPHSLPPGHPQFPPPSVTPGEPHVIAIKTDTPPPNIVQIPVEVNEPPRHLPPPGPEPQLIHLGPDPRAPPPRLPIPLLPSTSEPPPMSVMVSIPPPNSSLMSMPPPGNNMPEPFPRTNTPPNSVSAILGLARMGTGTLPVVSSAMIPGLTSSAAMVNGDSLVSSVHENRLKAEGTLNELEKISELLNTQAQLMVVSKERQNSDESDARDSNKSGVAIKMEDVFKVPLVPAGKSGGKTEVDATEVVDMDMGSPINEEGNIELPVSPQFDNLIDNPEDLLEEDFNKKMQKLHEKDVKIEKDKTKDKALTPTKNKDVKDLEKKDSPFKSKDEKHKRSSKENKHDKSGHKSRRHKTKPENDLKEKALMDAHLDLDTQEVPSSAVDMTNKEKYLKKLHLQERVVEEVKMAIKPFYSGKKITKDQYKDILRKAVPKICHSKSGNINPMKIKSLVEAYVEKYTKNSDQSQDDTFPSPEVNGESAKTKIAR